MSEASTNRTTISRHIESILPLLKKEPEGNITKPYLSVVWSDHPYSRALFGWDAHFIALGLAERGEPEHLRNHVDNFLDAQDQQTGFVPFYRLLSGDAPAETLDMYYPLLAQAALVYTKLTNDKKWAATIIGRLISYLAYYERNQRDISGLFFNRYSWSGVDNDAALAFFPTGSVCTPFLNSLLYLEYTSVAGLAAYIGEVDIAAEYEETAQTIARLIDTLLWSEQDGCYAPYNRQTGDRTIRIKDDLLNPKGKALYSFLSFTNLLPLYAGVCMPNRANEMIDRFIASDAHFFSDWGVRSLSRSSEYYNNAIWGFPPRFEQPERYTSSNWQGPVWFLGSYFIFRGLLNYGRDELAELIMDNLFRALANDIERNGMMHENYNAETGTPLYGEYFASWNTLADLLPVELDTGKSVADIYIDKRI